jgi:hypothetical protein
VWNFGVDNNVTILNDVWTVMVILYGIAVNGTVSLANNNFFGYMEILGTYGLDYRNSTRVHGPINMCITGTIYAYGGADLTLYNLSFVAFFGTDCIVHTNLTNLVGNAPFYQFDYVITMENGEFISDLTSMNGIVKLHDTIGWGINTRHWLRLISRVWLRLNCRGM